MKIPPALRLALVPIGVAIAHKGLSYLSDEAERLDAEIEARRAELAAAAIRDTCPDCEREGLSHCYGDQPAPEKIPPSAESSTPAAGKSPARKVGALVANVAAFGAGAYLAMRAQAWLQQRAAAELAAGLLPEPAPGACGKFPAIGNVVAPCSFLAHHPGGHSWETDPEQGNEE